MGAIYSRIKFIEIQLDQCRDKINSLVYPGGDSEDIDIIDYIYSKNKLLKCYSDLCILFESELLSYVESWRPGDIIPLGYTECDGVKPDGMVGKHIRKFQYNYIGSVMPRKRLEKVPELYDGESFFGTIDGVIFIVRECHSCEEKFLEDTFYFTPYVQGVVASNIDDIHIESLAHYEIDANSSTITLKEITPGAFERCGLIKYRKEDDG